MTLTHLFGYGSSLLLLCWYSPPFGFGGLPNFAVTELSLSMLRNKCKGYISANKAKQGILLKGEIDNNGEMEKDSTSLDCGYIISNNFTNCTSGGRNLNVTTFCKGGNKTSVDTKTNVKRPIAVSYGLLGGGSFHSGLENSSSLDFESSHRWRTVSQSSDQWSNEGSVGSSHETGGISTQKTAVEV